MRKTKFQRVTALVLAFVFLICGGMSVSAAGGGSLSDTSSIDYLRELLNSISYNEYLADDDNKKVDAATNSIEIDATKGYEYTKTAKPSSEDTARVETYDGIEGLYVPAEGTVSWTTKEITSAAKYSIAIEYYPVHNKSASIERVFMINGKVPFAEARYLTISKIWQNTYSDGSFMLEEGENAADYLSKAKELGIEATEEKRDDGTYIRYKMPAFWTDGISELVDDKALRFFDEDIDDNEIRASLTEDPAWSTYEFRDASGFFQEPFEFVLAPDADGNVTLALESVNEPIAISKIYLYPQKTVQSYDEYIGKYANAKEGGDVIKIEAEYFTNSSSQTIYPVEDRTSAITSPSATNRTVLNTVGGEKWQTAGQWISYDFKVGSSGLYQLAARYRQAVLDGMFVSRALYLYSGEGVEEGEDGYYNGIPFAEAANLRFGYSSDWQSDAVNDGEVDGGFKFYFKEGVVYTLKLEVTLGSMGPIVNTVQESLDSINADYLNILKLTGSNPDDSRDYGFSRVMYGTVADLITQSRVLYDVSEDLATIAGDKSSMTATLEKIARLLENMGKDEDQIAKSLDQLKTNIGSLGTWLGDAKTQPLQLDYISIQGASEELPEADAGFWKSIVYELSRFIQSFFRNYDRMGAKYEVAEDESIEVWLAYGRDQSQVIRSLINNDFAGSEKGVPVDLKLVVASTLLPSILSGKGPDVYIGLGQGDVINYAIRGALIPIDDQSDYDEVVENFNEAAMMVLEIEDSTGETHCYGLPETQTFNMMFLREDILAELEIRIPKTWDDIYRAIPTLQANNMQIGMHTDYKIFLYQMGGELYADGGMRINLDSNVALEAFDTMCRMFTENSFPYKYDFANRFRTGEMPIGFAAYTATYNQLKVFATEIEGLWGMYPMPGYATEEGINYESVSTVSAIVMITDCKDTEGAWNFMAWHAGADCQAEYSNEMVALIGPSAKHPTANKDALKELPWTSEELNWIEDQFYNLASIPNYPGSYIIDRYTNFAFLDAYNNAADPITELQSYITTINKEITRKRTEFELETLDYVGQTLAGKRMTQATTALEELKASSSYSSSYDGVYNRALDAIEVGDTADDYASLRSAANALEEANSSLFADAIRYMRQAAEALESYEAYK